MKYNYDFCEERSGVQDNIYWYEFNKSRADSNWWKNVVIQVVETI